MSLTIPLPSRDASPSSSEPQTPGSIIIPDSEPEDETQSCHTSTKSLNQSIFDYVRENGRTYHRYKLGSYPFPNDPPELARMNVQFLIIQVLFRFRNYFAPLKDPRTILDIGTGTGIWAVQMGREFPDAAVVATDLSPTQPGWVPRNVKFIIDDANEDDWMVEPQDYIHTRLLLGCFRDFRVIIQKGFQNLKPGGWMESQEIMPTIYCDDGTMAPDFAFAEWVRTQDTAAMNVGKPMRIANKLKRWYEEAGFVDVHEEVLKLPINGWPKDPQFKLLGRFNEDNYLEGVQAWSLQLFQQGLNWTKDEIEVYLVHVRRAISNRNVHGYHKIFVVWGRKPEEHELATRSPSSNSPPVNKGRRY